MSTYERRRTRDEAYPFVQRMLTTVAEARAGSLLAPPMEGPVVCGTWRRLSPDIGDVDLLVGVDVGLEEFQWPGWVEHARRKAKKAWGQCRIGDDWMMMDLWAVPTEVMGAAMLFLTGPADWNVFLRQQADRKGWMLSQYGLFVNVGPGDKKVAGDKIDQPGSTETEILQLLEVPWLHPEERTDWRAALKERRAS